MKIEDIHSVFFVGIGGIGMSALARWFTQRGCSVGGYDRVATPLTKQLEKEGINIHYVDDLSLVPVAFKNKSNTLIIYTPAIPKEHSELLFFKSGGYAVKKRSEVLGMITKDHYTIAVAGTHGKTTTSSMIAHLLHGSKKGCSAFVGGIMTNYDSNLIIGDADAPVVVEADEFDRSFLQLHPDFSIVTSLDPDHLDIYENEGSMQQSYLDFMQLTDHNGKIILHESVAVQVSQRLGRAFSTYGLTTAQIRASNIRVEDSCFVFDYIGKSVIADIKLALPGFHNVSNAVAAITAALNQKMPDALVKERIESYRGVKRRFEYIFKSEALTYIDDYAHHPAEIAALLGSVRKLFPNKKITAIFQPHLYSRTRDFQVGFAESLQMADEVLLMEIYPARELPINGVSAAIIYDKIQGIAKQMVRPDDFPEILDSVRPEVLLTIGAGDIDKLVPLIKQHLNQEKK